MVKCLVYLVKKIIKMYNVDNRRVYVTGLSMGGYGTIALANERPDLFAAALPVCGGADFSDYSNLKGLPLWFFHGSDDDEHPASSSEKKTLVNYPTHGPPITRSSPQPLSLYIPAYGGQALKPTHSTRL